MHKDKNELGAGIREPVVNLDSESTPSKSWLYPDLQQNQQYMKIDCACTVTDKFVSNAT